MKKKIRSRMSFPVRVLDPDEVDGMHSGFAKVPYAVPVKLSKPLSDNGYGVATVDGIEMPRGATYCGAGQDMLLVPIGTAGLEYGKKYELKLSGFVGQDGKRFPQKKVKIKTSKRKLAIPQYAVRDKQALIAAREGIVLLKNENGVLPLDAESQLNCFGAGQIMYRNTATGASLINPRWHPGFIDAVREYSSFSLNEELTALYRSLRDVTPSGELLQSAREKSDTAVIFISRHSGEMQDNRPIKGQYYLSDDEESMIAAVSSVFEKTVAVINTGYPIDMRWTEKYAIKGIIYTGFAGMLSSYALAEILDGRTNPSAKLSCTWPLNYEDNPVSKNYPTLGEDDGYLGETGRGVRIFYEEDIYLGYRYFDTFNKPTAFSFGCGLSYTSFEITPVSCDGGANGIEINVVVTNTGEREGKEAVQLYVTAPDGRLEKPAHVLVDFDKTGKLRPGESELLTLSANSERYASFDEDCAAWLLEKGTYTVSVGSSLQTLSCAGRFGLAEDVVLRTVKHHAQPVEDIKRLTKANPVVDGTGSGFVSPDKSIPVKARRAAYSPCPLPKYKGNIIKWRRLIEDTGLLDSFVAQMTDDELCELNICAGGRFGKREDGAAGTTPAMRKYGIPEMAVADANTGVRVRTPNIGFPAGSVIASTFNKRIAYNVGRGVALEARELGISIILGPSMNIQRGVLNGRHPEYFSEDPLLAGVMAGMQGKGLEENGVGCCYKHMFCNNSDQCRMASQSIVSERALREIYLREFEIAFGVHKPTSVMTGYNSLNGIYPSESADLLQGLLREEWGFDGFIMSDWAAYQTADMPEMVGAGNCWICDGGPVWVRRLKTAVDEGKVSRAVLENNVRWLIKVMLHWNTWDK